MRQSVRCPYCNKHFLEFHEDANTGQGAYLCPLSINYDTGEGCARIYDVEDFKALEDEAESSSDEGDSDDGDDDYTENEEENMDQNGCTSDTSISDRDRKKQNVTALLSGNLVVRRQALLPKVLSVTDGAAIARQPFKSPCPNGQIEKKEQLTRRLCARKRFVPWGSQTPVLNPINNLLSIPKLIAKEPEEETCLPPGIEPLVLWHPECTGDAGFESNPIIVDPILVRFLRPHQREGVQFMFECVAGLREFSKDDENLAGCILADDMGLGKTLQSITLLYTLLYQGFDGKPMAKRVIIVTPTSLVSNWESEIKKWLDGRVQVIAMCETTRSDVLSGINNFLAHNSPYQVMIISYETFRMHSSKFEKEGSCCLLICDEAHRLKNDRTITNRALASLKCRRRILLSGTPMQESY